MSDHPITDFPDLVQSPPLDWAATPIRGVRRYEPRMLLAAAAGWISIAVAAWCALVALP